MEVDHLLRRGFGLAAAAAAASQNVMVVVVVVVRHELEKLVMEKTLELNLVNRVLNS